MMKALLIGLAVVLFPGKSVWLTNLSEAQTLARKDHKHILLNFSGSDWCGPCIILRREVLDAPEFLSMADSSLILVNADFPRMKKNQLGKSQQQANDLLADKYNPQGKFPLTLLLTADGRVINQWEGNQGLTASEFSSRVRLAIDGAGR